MPHVAEQLFAPSRVGRPQSLQRVLGFVRARIYVALRRRCARSAIARMGQRGQLARACSSNVCVRRRAPHHEHMG